MSFDFETCFNEVFFNGIFYFILFMCYKMGGALRPKSKNILQYIVNVIVGVLGSAFIDFLSIKECHSYSTFVTCLIFFIAGMIYDKHPIGSRNER